MNMLVVRLLSVALCIGFALQVIGVKVSAEEIALTPNELAYAKEMSFDPRALTILKEAGTLELTKCDLTKSFAAGETRLNGMHRQTSDDRFVLGKRDPDDKLIEDNLRRIMKKYPELQRVISEEYLPCEESDPKRVNDWKRQLEFREVMRPFSAYLQQERDEFRNQNMLSPMQKPSFTISDNITPEELSKRLHEKFEGKPLADKYKPHPRYAIRSYVVLSAEQNEKAKKLFGMNERAQEDMIRLLQVRLKPLGYCAYGGPIIEDSKLFGSEQQADDHRVANKIPHYFATIRRTKAWSVPYSFERGFGPGHFPIAYDADIEKVSEGQWRISYPERFELKVAFPTVFLVKDGSSQKDIDGVSKFDFVRLAGVDAPNYGINTDLIVDQLKKWDDEFGVQLISASSDRMLIHFSSVPQDESQLLTEIFTLCPEFVENTDPPNLVHVERFRKDFLKTHDVHFWWD